MSNKKTVQAFLLDKNGGALELSYEQLETVDRTNKILWVHFDYSSNKAKDWITNKSKIDSIAVDALLMEETRPRTTVLGDSLLIALRSANLNPNSKPENMVSIRLYVSENLIITTKKRNILSIREIINSFKDNSGPKSSSEFLIDLTYRITSRLEDIINQIEDRTDALEESLIDSSDSEFRNEILAIRRETIVFRRYLFPQKEALNKLYNDKVSWIDEYQRIELREINDQLMRHIEELDTIRDKVILIQEELANTLSEEMNKKMYVLSLISVIFLPLTFLTGLLGINIGGIPGAKDDNAFYVFSFILVVLVTIQFFIFKRKNWI